MKNMLFVSIMMLVASSACAENGQSGESTQDVLSSRSGLHWAVQTLEEGSVLIERRDELGEVTAEFEIEQTSAGIRIDQVAIDVAREKALWSPSRSSSTNTLPRTANSSQILLMLRRRTTPISPHRAVVQWAS
jgi:hypothetical protein